MKKLFNTHSGLRMLAAVMTLTIGLGLLTVPARADSKTDRIIEMINSRREQKATATPAPTAEPAAASDTADGTVTDVAPRSASFAASSTYLNVRVAKNVAVSDVVATVAQSNPDVTVLAAFHFDGMSTGNVKAELLQNVSVAAGEELLLVALNGAVINYGVSYGSLSKGKMMILNIGDADGLALVITGRPGVYAAAAPAEQPAQAAAPAETEAPKATATPKADVTAKSGEEGTPSSDYLQLKLTADATATDITASVTAAYPEIKVLAALHFDHMTAPYGSARMTKAVNTAKGQKLLLVGLNGSAINAAVSYPISKGKMVLFSATAVDGVALIVIDKSLSLAELAPVPTAAPVVTEAPAVTFTSADATAAPAVTEAPAAVESKDGSSSAPAEPDALPTGLKAKLSDGAVLVVSGDVPAGGHVEVKNLAVAVVKILNRGAEKDHVNLYAFELSIFNADGKAYRPTGDITVTVSGGQVAQYLANGYDISVSRVAGSTRKDEVASSQGNTSVSFPFGGKDPYWLEAVERPVQEVAAEPAPVAEAPAEAPAPADADALNVTIKSSMDGMILLGDTVTLTGTVENAPGTVYYVWECDRGAGYEPVDNAVGNTVTFTATQETLSWSWRLTVLSEAAALPASHVNN